KGLVIGKAKGLFREILGRLRVGYAVEARVVDAQWLGVPQQRQRVIFVGVRADLAALGFVPVFPTPLPYNYSMRAALPHLGGLAEQRYGFFEGVDYHAEDGPSPAIRVAGSPGSQQLAKVLQGSSVNYRSKGEELTEYPAPTIIAGGGSNKGAPHQFDIIVVQNKNFRDAVDVTDQPGYAVTAKATRRSAPKVVIRKIGMKEVVAGNVAP